MQGNGTTIGQLVPVATVWDLALAWYPGRHESSWQPLTPEVLGSLFDSVGLSGDFWAIP